MRAWELARVMVECVIGGVMKLAMVRGKKAVSADTLSEGRRLPGLDLERLSPELC